MSIRLRKISYQVTMDMLDDEGNMIEELVTQKPIDLWPHQLDQLPLQAAAIVEQASRQSDNHLTT